MNKVLIDVHATKSGTAFREMQAEINGLRLKIAQATKEAVESNGKWAKSSTETARKIKENMRAIEVASGRAARAQAGLTSGAGGRPSIVPRPGHSGAGGSAGFAGVGVLNYLSKIPGVGGAAAPLALFGGIAGVGKLAAVVGTVTVAIKALEAAFGFAVRTGGFLLRTFFDLTVQGYNYNAMLETTRAGTAAIITSFGSIVDAQGKAVEGSAKFDAALMISGSIQKRLRAAAIQTAASYEELVRVFQEGAAPAISKGFDATEITRLTIDVAQVAQAIGLPFDQLNQEIRGLLEGDMSRNSRIARVILADLREEAEKSGTTVEKELQKMAKLGTLPDFLHDRMIEFNRAAQMTANTLPVALSNLRDAFQSALGDATAGGVQSVTGKIVALTNSIVSFDQFGNAKFGTGFRQALGSMAQLMERLIKFTLDLALTFDELYFKAQAFFKMGGGQQAKTVMNSAVDQLDKLPWYVKQFIPGAGLAKLVAGTVNNAPGIYGRARQAGQINLPGQARQTYVEPKELTFDEQWQQELDRRQMAEMAATRAAARKGRMLLASGYTFEGETAKLGRQDYRIQGMDADAFYGQVSKVLSGGKAGEIMSLIDGINKAIKDDGIITLEEFNKVLDISTAGGFQLVNSLEAVEDAAGKTQAIEALIGKFQSLAASASSLENGMREISQRAATMGIDMDRDIASGAEVAAIRELESQINNIESMAGGKLTAADVNAIEDLEMDIAKRKEQLALIKARSDAREREVRIADLEADAKAKLLAVENASKELKKLEGERDKAGAGTAAALAIQGEIDKINASIKAATDGHAEIQRQLTELRTKNTTLETQDIKTIAAERVTNETAAAKKASEARAKIEDATAKKIKRANDKLLKELQREWERFGDILGRGVARAFEAVATGGSIKDAFDEIAGGIRDMIGGALQQTVSDWWKALSLAAQGGADGSAMGTPGQRQAKGVQSAIMIGGAAYSIWNQRGATRGQNVLGGAMTGAGVGATIGGSNPYTAIIGAVIGLVVGGIMGAFAPTGSKIGMRITSGPNGITVRGSGDTKPYQVTEAVSQINEQIKKVREGMYDILFNLPTHVLTALTANMQVKPLPFDRNIEAVTGAEDAIRDFITNQVPRYALNAYIPAVEQMAELLGVSEDKTKQLIAKFTAPGADADTVIKLVRDFFDSIARLQEVMVGGSMNIRDRMAYATRRANMPVQDQLRESGARIAALIPRDFDTMSLEDQTSYAQRLLPLIEERYEMELQYLAQIDQAMKDSLKSIDDQIFEFQMEDMDPQQQMDALLERNRAIIDQLSVAQTPEEIQRLQGEYQQNIARMVQIGGNRPEDRANAIAALDNFRDLVEGRYNAIIDQVEAAGDAYYAQIQRILDALETGLDAALPKPSNPVEGAPGIDPDGGWTLNPDGTWTPPGKFDPELGKSAQSLISLGNAAQYAADMWNNQFGEAGGDTGANVTIGDSSTEKSSQTVVVNVAPAPVVIEGDIGRFLQQVKVEAVQESIQRTLQILERRGKKRAGGRF